MRHLKKQEGAVDPDVLLGLDAPDDAAVYRLTDQIAIVQTVDFFTPIVDDPYAWGAIAVANALSDVYAMGARPVTGLNLVAWPMALDMSVLGRVLEGGAAKAREAGVSIVGGHSVDDSEPKYGMAVTGLVDPATIIRSSGAKAGMSIVLTKPLGTGIAATAIKRGVASDDLIERVTGTMTALNAAASEAAIATGVGAVTDVTGFGFLGHLHQMLATSGVGGHIWSSKVPFIDGVRALAADGFVPGGTRRNASHYGGFVEVSEGVDDVTPTMLFDAQTSGGLLIAVDQEAVERLVAELEARSVMAARVGEVTGAPAGSIVVEP